MTLENARNQPPTSSRTFVTQNPLEPALGTTRNPAMQEALNTIRRIAATDISVLIVGEHGTGKEWAALSIHRLSNRANGSFHTVECSAIPPENIEKEIFGYEAINWNGVEIKRGAFEEASGGTLLLDEIEFLPAALQLMQFHISRECSPTPLPAARAGPSGPLLFFQFRRIAPPIWLAGSIPPRSRYPLGRPRERESPYGCYGLCRGLSRGTLSGILWGVGASRGEGPT